MPTDINQSVMDQLNDISTEISSVQTDDNDSDDDFEKLLNDFIFSEKTEKEDPVKEKKDQSPKDVKEPEKLSQNPDQNTEESDAEDAPVFQYGPDENELVQAYQNFISAIIEIAQSHKVKMSKLIFVPESLYPNYKPSLGRKINADTMAGWDVMLKAFPDEIASLSPDSSDEEFLNFAERLTDQDLQLAIISYVEILIDIENCEISYEERRLKAQRRRIEREIYEEYQRRRERKQRFIDALKKQNFPIDEERLINNYFKTANKDPIGAFDMLTKNPAVYAPIETNKIKPKLFGLIKPTPEDGIRENHRIGVFLRKFEA